MLMMLGSKPYTLKLLGSQRLWIASSRKTAQLRANVVVDSPHASAVR